MIITPICGSRTAQDQQKMRDMRESWGPWKASPPPETLGVAIERQDWEAIERLDLITPESRVHAKDGVSLPTPLRRHRVDHHDQLR